MMNQRIYYSREAELQAKREATVRTLLFLGIGMAVGGILALLFAPESSKGSGRDLAGTLEDAYESGRDTAGRAMERLQRDLNDLRKQVEDRLRS
jgi:gas vesicle protein